MFGIASNYQMAHGLGLLGVAGSPPGSEASG